ncbi:MAG: mitochondrial fission ELM1 family protein [Rhizomicrobium sp.]
MNADLVPETWVVTEGAAGMENQCLGLADRLPFPVRVFRSQLKRPWRWLAPRFLGSVFAHATKASNRLAPPWPTLLIACGRQSIPFSRAVRRASGGGTFTVQCQDPRIAPKHFDLVIPTEHDGLTGPNVFPIIGSPNRITPQRLAKARGQLAHLFEPLAAPRVAVLVGGASRTHGTLDRAAADRFGALLAQIAPDHRLMVSTSRRTSPAAAAALQQHLAGTDSYVWDGSGENPYLGLLAWADAFVVTADSVNMICEAAATGRPVHVFPLPRGRRKAGLFQQALAERAIIRPFFGRIEQWRYVPLDETGRAVEHIRRLLDLPADAPDMRHQGP